MMNDYDKDDNIDNDKNNKMIMIKIKKKIILQNNEKIVD